MAGAVTGPGVSVADEPLSPVGFLDRAALHFADRTAVVDRGRRTTYGELRSRARRLAGLLANRGVAAGDRVAVLSPNAIMPLEAHFGVPLAGAVLVPLNTRLSAGELAQLLDHSGAGVLLCDAATAALGADAVDRCGHPVDVVLAGRPAGPYERELAGAPELAVPVADERALLGVNYTSGTTGRPKGVMVTHRGAYLQALGMVIHSRLAVESTFLWTLPLFHCNGWTYPWAVAAVGGRHVCPEDVDPATIWRYVREEDVTHLNAAPTVLNGLVWHDEAARHGRIIDVAVGGAPPSPTLLGRMDELGMRVTHFYGLTETYGPGIVGDRDPAWADLPLEERAALAARQGGATVVGCPVRVVDGDGHDVPEDGTTVGEVLFRGNVVTPGYYRDPAATAAATVDGWLRSGDLGVVHPGGAVELRDRAKDIIISGGENIASIEVEQAIASHPAVLEAAVVAVPDERWGEVPGAFVALKPGATATAEVLIAHVKDRIARFKAPKHVWFAELPKTSTGKIQKFALRERVWEGRDRRVS